MIKYNTQKSFINVNTILYPTLQNKYFINMIDKINTLAIIIINALNNYTFYLDKNLGSLVLRTLFNSKYKLLVQNLIRAKCY